MGLFGRDDKDSKETPREPAKESRPPEPRPFVVESKPQPPAVPTAAKEPMITDKDRGDELGEINAYLGRGSRVSGKLNFDGTVRVDGQVEGEISANELIVGERAIVTAQINGQTIVIRGKVTGDINARKRVEIRSPGKLYGNIVTPSLVIHDGVIFEGHCSMGGGETRVESKVTPIGKEEKGGNSVLARLSSEATK